MAEPVRVPGSVDDAELEPLAMIAARIAPQHASQLIRALPELSGLKHVKRIRRRESAAGPPVLLILIGPLPATNDWGNEADDAARLVALLPDPVAAALVAVGAPPESSLELAAVPRLPPRTRESAAAWMAAGGWPVTYTILASTTGAVRDGLSAEDGIAMRAGMAAAAAAASIAQSRGDRHNGCALVDPGTGAVMASGGDETVSRRHPLRHAALVAIAAAAERDLRLFPFAPVPDSDSTGKRRRADGAVTPLGDVPASSPGRRVQYLCTGWDCYLLREPCALCAMALTHARVRRVVYAQPDAAAGALGSASAAAGGRRLHGVRSLNHHYEVFALDAELPG